MPGASAKINQLAITAQLHSPCSPLVCRFTPFLLYFLFNFIAKKNSGTAQNPSQVDSVG